MSRQQFCSRCHADPDPSLLSRSAWPDRIDAMFEIARQSNAQLKQPLPSVGALREYYASRAPERLSFRVAAASSPPSAFLKQLVRWDTPEASAARISHVQFAQLAPRMEPVLLGCDARTGMFGIATLSAQPSFTSIAALDAPCRAHVADLDRDGRADILVADIGDTNPTDARHGAIYWLRQDRRGGWHKLELAAALGRVCDIDAADFDSDGDVDLIVGEFGWRTVGGILFFENQGWRNAYPILEPRYLDARSGTVELQILDIDGDADLDFVALVAQEHESVDAFLNDGKGAFFKRNLFQAGHPAWGASGIEAVDIDQDNDVDLLLSNGDTFDEFLLKPYHGISLLENTAGDFRHRILADLPAAYSARAGDIDGDGDLDIAAGAYYAPPPPHDSSVAERLESLIWLEQTKPGQFDRHVIEAGLTVHAALAVGTVNGRVQIAAGNWISGPYERDARLSANESVTLYSFQRPEGTQTPPNDTGGTQPPRD